MGTREGDSARTDGEDGRVFQAHFEVIAEMSSDGICVHRDGKIVFANAAAVRWMGVDPTVGLIGRRVAEFVHADSFPGVERRLRKLGQDGESTTPSEVVMGRPEKSFRDVQATSRRVLWNGQPSVVTSFRDLTTAKAAAILKYQAALLDHVSDAVIGVSPTGVVTSWNAAAEDIYGREERQVLGRPVEDAVGVAVDVAQLATSGSTWHTTQVAASGSPLAVRVSAAVTGNGYVLICADLTALRRAEHHFEAVVTALDAGVIVFDPNGSVVSANPTARRIAKDFTNGIAAFGADVAFFELDGRRVAADLHPVRRAIETGTPQLDHIVGVDQADGRRRWLSVSTRPLGPGPPQRSPVLCSVVDVTAQKLINEQLVHAAHHDVLTGLPNRFNAETVITASLAPSTHKRISALLFLDIDNVKQVNDTYGHSAGDAVLSATAARMGRVLRDGQLLARLAGDEFVVLLFEPTNRPDLATLADGLHLAASAPTRHHDIDITITVSIGVVEVGDDDSRDARELLGAADQAMYSAKSSGPGRTRYAT